MGSRLLRDGRARPTPEWARQSLEPRVSRQVLLLRIGSRNTLVIVDQGSRHDARLRTQEIGSQSGHLVWLDQLSHGLRRFRFR
jgi:hypothetical protein